MPRDGPPTVLREAGLVDAGHSDWAPRPPAHTPRQGRWKRRSRYLIAAALLHLVWAGGWYLGESADDSDSPEPQRERAKAVIVRLVSPIPSEPAMQPSAEAAAEKESQPAQPPPDPRRPSGLSPPMNNAPSPEKSAPVDPALVTDPPPRREMDASVVAVTDASPIERPTPTEVSVADPLSGIHPVEGVDPQPTTWESQVLAHLERNKRYPALALQRGQEDRVSVRIRVDRAGQVVSQHIVDSRGYILLDQEVLALIGRANPLPPPPAEIRDQDLEFLVPVEFFIDRQTVRIW